MILLTIYYPDLLYQISSFLCFTPLPHPRGLRESEFERLLFRAAIDLLSCYFIVWFNLRHLSWNYFLIVILFIFSEKLTNNIKNIRNSIKNSITLTFIYFEKERNSNKMRHLPTRLRYYHFRVVLVKLLPKIPIS